MITRPNDPINIKDGAYRDEFNNMNPGTGLTKREYFAAFALQGILANANAIAELEYWSKFAVKYADALVEELNKEKK